MSSSYSTGVMQARGPGLLGQFKTRTVNPIIPFFTMLYFRAQRILMLARGSRGFHMLNIYIARQALHLVILLNDLAYAGNGLDSQQMDEREVLADELVELETAMRDWSAIQGFQDTQSERSITIKTYYNRFFRKRFYFENSRDPENDTIYQRLLAYDTRGTNGFNDIPKGARNLAWDAPILGQLDTGTRADPDDDLEVSSLYPHPQHTDIPQEITPLAAQGPEKLSHPLLEGASTPPTGQQTQGDETDAEKSSKMSAAGPSAEHPAIRRLLQKHLSSILNSQPFTVGTQPGNWHPAGFTVPPPPPPPFGIRPINIANSPRDVGYPVEDSHYSIEGVASPQFEPFGWTSRRLLSRPPGQSSSTGSSEMRQISQNEFGAGGGADPYQTRFTSLSSWPPSRLAPSPSSHWSSSSSSVQRESIQSIQSGSSGIPASFNTMDPPPWAVDPPPWAVTHPEDEITRGGTIVPETQLVRVEINRDPGRMVSSNLGGFDLFMHKGDTQTIPSYGRGEQVEGYVDLKVLDHIAEIEVTMQGTLHVVYSERGVAYDEVSVQLFTESKTLYTSAWGRAPGQSHPFSFTFPDKCVDSNTALPPTWSLLRPGVSAEVSYIIRAVLKRKGLFRKDEKVSTKVEYYPRTAPPLPEIVSPTGGKKRELRVLEMKQNLRRTGLSAVNKPMIPITFTARISLRLPLIYASGSTIPYTVSLSSPVGTSVLASLDVEVSIIKTSKVVIKKKPYEKRDIIATGINTDKQFELGHRQSNTNSHEPNEGSTVTIQGSIVAGTKGNEMSWGVEGVATITYVIRFVVTPTQQASEFIAFKDTLPTFEISEDIVLITDETSTLLSDAEARLPARGLGRTRSSTAATGLTHMSSRNSYNAGVSLSSPTRETGRESLYNARRITSRPASDSGPVL